MLAKQQKLCLKFNRSIDAPGLDCVPCIFLYLREVRRCGIDPVGYTQVGAGNMGQHACCFAYSVTFLMMSGGFLMIAATVGARSVRTASNSSGTSCSFQTRAKSSPRFRSCAGRLTRYAIVYVTMLALYPRSADPIKSPPERSPDQTPKRQPLTNKY